MANKPAQQISLEIAKRLTALRLDKAWTRQTLAEKAEINVHTLKRFERSGQISLERLVAISQALDAGQELERLFKPRQRISVENWQVQEKPQRKRGRRSDATHA